MAENEPNFDSSQLARESDPHSVGADRTSKSGHEEGQIRSSTNDGLQWIRMRDLLEHKAQENVHNLLYPNRNVDNSGVRRMPEETAGKSIGSRRGTDRATAPSLPPLDAYGQVAPTIRLAPTIYRGR